MRYNSNKDVNSPPASLLNSETKQNRIALGKDLKSIEEEIYKGPKVIIIDNSDPYHSQEEFENRYILRNLFYNKCAYCEKIDYKPDVEHFRPKKGVTNPNGNKHGYYWLCYNWTNLLPACSKCNSGQGKWNKFPISGLRIVLPPISNGKLIKEECKINSNLLLQESAKLINPEIDNPNLYLRLKWDGSLEGIDGADGRGWTSINCYDLNRGNLKYGRKKIIDRLINNFRNAFNLFRDIGNANTFLELLTIYFENLNNIRMPSEEYSFVSEYIFNHFDNFVDENISGLEAIEIALLKQEFSKFNL